MASLLFLVMSVDAAADVPRAARERDWPDTDFDNSTVDLEELMHGGPPKDGIRSIDDPQFAPAHAIKNIRDMEPVISIELGGDVRAYPFRIMIIHEIVNDRAGGIPIAVTYCPLCNSAIVFSRDLEGEEYEFGTTGWLRHSDLVMYDRTTESWWQQFSGEAIVGQLAGRQLRRLPARIESFARFRERHPAGDVLLPDRRRPWPYGQSPYAGYDSRSRPYYFAGDLPPNIHPLARVVSVGDRAWALSLVRREKRIETEDGLIISWTAGQNSALDEVLISEGRDVGNVVVERRNGDETLLVPYGVDFAFAFHAFYPESAIIVD